MKHLVVIFLFLIGVSGCSKSWTEEDQKDFMNDCLTMQGAQNECLCVMACLEIEYQDYDEALVNVPKSELNERLKKCLQQCKK